ncbi:MAG TPA: glucokinase, partial [Candidatus Binataceae bacterium]|nr:glucokinase [Candidatus Binataceae bacterium]
MMVLAGDIGGTKTHLGLYSADQARLSAIRDHTYVTREFSSLEAVLHDFISEDTMPGAACLGVPGPVIDGVAHGTNIPWDVRAQSVAAALHNAPTRLINDLEATAYGMLHLAPAEICELHEGQ